MFKLTTYILLVLLTVACTKELEPVTTGTMTDARDGRLYRTVTINGDTWFAENLAYLPFLKVRTIPGAEQDVPDGPVCIYDYLGESIEEAKLTENYQKYGCLYQVSVSTIDTLCPEGWHVSTDKEWERLERIVGTDAAGILKLKSAYGWTDGKNGTDDLGFGLLPGGSYSTDGNEFGGLGLFGCLASSSKMFSWNEGSLERSFIYRTISDKVFRYTDDDLGSVRCVKDK